MRVRSVLMLWILATGTARAQLQLPPTDGSGQVLVPEGTIDMALHHQQEIIYFLLLLLGLSIAANVWLSYLFLRMQYLLERVSEAVRRVDVLSQAFQSVSLQWDRTVAARVSQEVAADLDQDDDAEPLENRWRQVRD